MAAVCSRYSMMDNRIGENESDIDTMISAESSSDHRLKPG